MMMPSTLSDETPSMNRMPMFMSVTAWVRPKGTTRKVVKAVMTTATGASQNTSLSALVGHDVFLDEQLDGVGERLQQAVRAYAHGAVANLDVGQNFALQPVHGEHGQRYGGDHQQHVDGCPEQVAGFAGGHVRARYLVRRSI